MSYGTRSLLLAAPVVWLSFVGCGGEPGSDRVVESTEAVTASQSFLVSFTGGGIPANADALVSAAGGKIAARYLNVGAVLARSSNPAFAATLRGTTGIDAVGGVAAVRSQISPVSPKAAHHPISKPPGSGDPLSFRQWDMDQIHAPQARAIAPGKKSVLVGLFDSGIDVTHPDLVGQVNAAASATCVGGIADSTASVWQNDVIGHGTFVSGVIAGLKNGIGIVGVAPGVQLSVVKVATDDGMVLADAFVCAIDWAIGHNYDLINASLTIDPFTAPIDDIFCSDQPDREAIVKMVRRAILAAGAKKISMVAATGNFFTDLANLHGATPGSNCKVIPVQLPRVIGVSAVGVDRQLSWFANYGFGAVDLTAPGGSDLVPYTPVGDGAATGQILSSVPPGSFYYQAAAGWDGQVQDCKGSTCGTYAYLEGTSAATPHVTGVAALLESKLGRVAPEVLLARMSLTANPLPCPPSPYDPGGTGQPATCSGPPAYNNFYGAGEVDALAAIR
jgi:subtilisin family serine protease